MKVITTASRTSSALAALLLLPILSACAGPVANRPAAASSLAASEPVTGVTEMQAQAVVGAEDRTGDDRLMDPQRRPAELLAFLEVSPGSRLAVLVAGGGYTAELLARAVAPNGIVYAENPAFARASVDKAWAERLTKPAMKTVVRVDRELEDPLPADARDLDVVLLNLVYHDTVWLGTDRQRMNRAVFAALRRGGKYVIIDHSARPGSGVADARTLHRIDPTVVMEEVERAGFQLQREGDFLRNPSDTRDWNDSPEAAPEWADPSDRFVLMFVKP